MWAGVLLSKALTPHCFQCTVECCQMFLHPCVCSVLDGLNEEFKFTIHNWCVCKYMMNFWNICVKLQKKNPYTDLCSLQHLITQNWLRVLTQIVPSRALWLLKRFFFPLLHWLHDAVLWKTCKIIFGNISFSYTEVLELISLLHTRAVM